MAGKYKIMIGTLILFLSIAAGGFLYYKRTAPPGEEWLAYHNEDVTANIDSQLYGLDIAGIVRNKETYVIEKEIAEIQNAIKDGSLTYEELTAICLYRIKTLDNLIAFNNKDKDSYAKYGQDYLEEAAKAETADSDEINKSVEKATSVLNTAFTENNLDGIAFLNSTAPTLPAAAGFPQLTIPLGKNRNGVPQGATLIVQDEILLQMGYSLQEHANGRRVVCD